MDEIPERNRYQYVSPKVEPRRCPDKGSLGLYAAEPIAKDEMVLTWGGRVVDGATLRSLTARERMHAVQVEDDLYLCPLGDPEPADFANHSCAPNAGICGQISLVAMRPIEPGEEICFDYAMSDASPYDEFDCGCGASTCRGRVTGDDWKSSELWERYSGYFSHYIQRRIDRLQGDAQARADAAA